MLHVITISGTQNEQPPSNTSASSEASEASEPRPWRNEAGCPTRRFAASQSAPLRSAPGIIGYHWHLEPAGSQKSYASLFLQLNFVPKYASWIIFAPKVICKCKAQNIANLLQIPRTSAGPHLVQNLISWLKCEAIPSEQMDTNGTYLGPISAKTACVRSNFSRSPPSSLLRRSTSPADNAAPRFLRIFWAFRGCEI